MNTQKTILIEEDEKSLRDAVVDILKLKNFLTLEAKNGREGVDLALKKHPVGLAPSRRERNPGTPKPGVIVRPGRSDGPDI